MTKEKKEKRVLLGEILLGKGLITQGQLEIALEEQKKTGKPLAQIITEKNWTDKDRVYKVLSEQLNIPYQNLSAIEIPPDIVALIPESTARSHCLVPIKKENDTLIVAMAEPQNIFAIDELRNLTGFKINPVLATREEILSAMERYYAEETAIEKTLPIAKIEEEEKKGVLLEEDADKIRQFATETPIIKLVDAMIIDAVRARASDIHIEPHQNIFCVRFRIDGVLHDITSPPKYMYKHVVSRVKIIANMDIAERRLPQDGSFKVELKDKEIDIRVSTYPTIYGEKVVMRLLVKEAAFLDLGELGFEPDDLVIFESLIRKSCGIILVVGPTGSGKTTTLYSVLNKINTREKNIITIEDPIEYKFEGISQSQINLKAGFTFANSLRSMMRQDPNIIMVGEIRDLETAQLAVRAALTGHLVLSTLHTNDAPGAVTRLIDMGIEPYLISSSLIGVLAQRLVRVICPECKEEFTPPPSLLENFREEMAKIKEQTNRFYRGKGCDFCKRTGYRGRTGVFELLDIAGDEMREAVTMGSKTPELKRLAIEKGMKTLKESGLIKALKGITTLDELLRTTELV